MGLQVPDSFYFNKSSVPESKKEVGDRRHIGDDSFREMMANERRKIKETDDRKQKKGEVDGSPVAEVEEEEEEEFSIFGKTKKKPTNAPVRERPSGGKSKAPFFDQPAAKKVDKEPEFVEEEGIAEDDMIAVAPNVDDPLFEEPPVITPLVEEEPQAKASDDPNAKALRQGKELPEPHETLVQNRQAPDATQQQKVLDQARTDGAFVFVDKKDKKDEKALFEYGSKTKPAPSGQTARTITTSEGGEAEVLETPTQEIVQGKVDIKEQAHEPHKDIALPGSKEGKQKFQQTLEQAQPEIRNAVGMTEVRKEEPKDKIEAPVEEGDEKQELESSKRKSKDDVPLDPKAIAMVHDGAFPKERNAIAINTNQPVEKPPLGPKLQEIVDQIIKEIYTINNEGKSETTIILQHPPLFNGVKVTIQTFEHARNELNITFSNLTGPGKRVLDENLPSLRLALENNDRNFVVHQLITTTLDEVPRYIADAQQSRERDQGQQEQQQQKHKKPEEEQQEDDKKK